MSNDQQNFQQFKSALLENFELQNNSDREILDKAIDSIFKLFTKKDYKDFKVEVENYDTDIMIVKIVSHDRAFIVDSTMNEFKRSGVEIINMEIPVFYAERDSDGNLKTLNSKNTSINPNESVSIFILKNKSNIDEKDLQKKLEETLECVFASNKDWQLSKNLVQDLRSKASDENTEKFLDWLLNNNFIFLATCKYKIDKNKIIPNNDSFSGLLKATSYTFEDFVEQNIVDDSNQQIIFRKTSVLSRVHRNSNMEVIHVQSNDDYVCFVGFFTSTVYHQNLMSIPIVNEKIMQAIARHDNLEKTGYIVKELFAELQNYPRAELFQMSVDEVYDLTMCLRSIILLPRVKIFVRNNHNSSFKSILVFIPKEKFSMDLHTKIEEIVCEKMSVQAFKRYAHISEKRLVTIQLIVRSIDGKKNYDLNEIEDAVASVTWGWKDILKGLLQKKYDHKDGNEKFSVFNNAFDNEYIVTNTPEKAVDDIENIESLISQHKEKLFKFISDDAGYNFRIYSKSERIEVSDLLPAIENAGFCVIDIINHDLKLSYNSYHEVFIHHLNVRPKSNNLQHLDYEHLKSNLETLLEVSVAGNKVDQDKFNSLILYAGLSWQDVIVCRVFARYLKQLGLNYDIDAIIQTLVENPSVTKCITALFNIKFSDLNTDRESIRGSMEIKKSQILELLTKVESAVADKILRCYLEVIEATKRTNFFISKDFDYVSFKIASSEVSFAPLPKPFMEIFVYSTRFEGIHLRGGKVARGGIRWSDRRLDYRTEVLGLMKAQMTKNSVIVPVGSKGGFVVKSISPKDRENFLKEGVNCYKMFLRGLLDITDNFEGSEVIRTKNNLCWDELDPYLVVAADKGTATFSDYANSLSKEYNFWLGDAFASGGSAGYDHKKLAITSRGAWISVLQHFNILGVNPHEEEIRVIGIGDMSGDVFGNGMLMSDKIRLVGVFNHMHIFIDPNPDAAKGYLERRRLFDKPGSQWSDYNQDLISKGGGIFQRSAKSIQLSVEMKEALGIDQKIESLTPDELIRAILKSPVDLLWNGGIGTYVKSSTEANEQIRDKANDNLRINGKDLRCKVVGEGGNLGFTQLGRVEYARIGGCINTDAIDNSGGVDCSDHEVNLKIAFAPMMPDKNLTIEERNEVLAKMSDEVCQLVLKDNRLQTQILSIESEQAHNKIWEHLWVIDHLEAKGELNREVERLPSKEDFHKMVANSIPLTKPDLCVLLAYAKNSAIKMLEDCHEISELFDKEPYKRLYNEYFPQTLRDNPKYSKYLQNHRLRNQILVTILVNDFVNTMGCTYFHLMVENQGVSPIKLMKAFCNVKYALCIDDEWLMIEQLKGQISGDSQLKLFKLLQVMISRNIEWLSHIKITDINGDNHEYKEIYQMVQKLIANVSKPNGESDEGKLICNLLGVEKIPTVLIPFLIKIQVSYFALDVFFASQQNNISFEKVAPVYRAIHKKMKFDLMNRKVAELFFKMHYDSKIATMIVLKELEALLMRVAVKYINCVGEEKVLQDNFKSLDLVCDNLDSYLRAVDEAGAENSWSNDIVSLLVLLKKKLRSIIK